MPNVYCVLCMHTNRWRRKREKEKMKGFYSFPVQYSGMWHNREHASCLLHSLPVQLSLYQLLIFTYKSRPLKSNSLISNLNGRDTTIE